MKIMKLMQVRYVYLRKVEIELRQLEETDRPPERPSKQQSLLFTIYFKIKGYLLSYRLSVSYASRIIELVFSDESFSNCVTEGPQAILISLEKSSNLRKGWNLFVFSFNVSE